jgi:hypothetical protein
VTACGNGYPSVLGVKGVGAILWARSGHMGHGRGTREREAMRVDHQARKDVLAGQDANWQ